MPKQTTLPDVKQIEAARAYLAQGQEAAQAVEGLEDPDLSDRLLWYMDQAAAALSNGQHVLFK